MLTLGRACLLSLGLHALAFGIWASWPARGTAPAQPEPPLAVRLAGGESAAHAFGALRAEGRSAGRGAGAASARRPRPARPPEARPLSTAAAPQAAPASQISAAATAGNGSAGGREASAPGGMAAQGVGRSDGDHEALYRPAYLENPQPPYPERSLQLGEEGEVLLKVRVGVNGQALQVTLARSSGFRRLDQAAINAVARWRFVPARRGGAAVESVLTIPVRFRQ